MIVIKIKEKKPKCDRVGNYDVTIYEGNKKIATGDIKGHYKPNGYKGLIKRLEEQLAKFPNKED